MGLVRGYFKGVKFESLEGELTLREDDCIAKTGLKDAPRLKDKFHHLFLLRNFYKNNKYDMKNITKQKKGNKNNLRGGA